jgi:cellulose synthase/poly-beta-1,6-N-acetylglucosamine synthase-like glycosyltransferase
MVPAIVATVSEHAFADPQLERATLGLRRRSPELSAHPVLTARQRFVLAALAVAVGVALVADADATVVALAVLGIAFNACAAAYRLFFCTYGLVLGDAPEATPPERAPDEELPMYTILVPLYGEAAVVPALIRAITALDYPAAKLDVKLLLEADDEETAAAVEAIAPGPPFEVVVVPDGQPKTKPKACNYGVLTAKGEHVVIFDAEDIPDRDQLRKAVHALKNGPADLVCMQARLNIWNRKQNVLTRVFTAEYCQRFDLYLPGLARVGAPIPLGGASNHFRLDVLRELGYWDPFNVAEDLDLGLRLARAGYRTETLQSTTYQESVSRVGPWIRQRSRWTKGFIQTWLVHMRHPIRLWRELGPAGWAHFQLIVAGAVVPLLLAPVSLPLLLLWASGVPALPQPVLLALAVNGIANTAVTTVVNLAGLLRRGHRDLAPYVVLFPPYGLLMSLAAWRGLVQLVLNPSYWEKTTHGVAGPAPAA